VTYIEWYELHHHWVEDACEHHNFHLLFHKFLSQDSYVPEKMAVSIDLT